MENAKNTFYIPLQKKYHHVLILDDAIGSGATINEIALKLKEKKWQLLLLDWLLLGVIRDLRSYRRYDSLTYLVVGKNIFPGLFPVLNQTNTDRLIRQKSRNIIHV